MTGKVYCNGKYFDENEPCIPITDRGFLFGDGVFTTIRVVNGVPEFFEAHIDRLIKQCETLKIDPPERLTTDVNDLILKNSASKGVWRLKIIITGGDKSSLALPRRKFGKHLMIITKVDENCPKNLRLTVFPHPVCRPSAHLKTLSYLDRLFISDYAAFQGFDDALVLSKEGYVMETAFSNIFWVQGLDVFIPDPNLELLMGIALTHEIEVLKKSGHRIHFVKEKLAGISEDAQVFICNSIKGVVPVTIEIP